MKKCWICEALCEDITEGRVDITEGRVGVHDCDCVEQDQKGEHDHLCSCEFEEVEA